MIAKGFASFPAIQLVLILGGGKPARQLVLILG